MTSTTPAPTETTATDELLGDVRRLGTVLLIAGAIGIVAGLLVIAYPDLTLLALGLIAGINLLLLGVMSLVDAFAAGNDTTTRVLSAVLGLIGIIAGLVVIRRPGESLLAVLIVIGIWLVVTGIVDFVRAFATLEDRPARLLGAIVDVVLGALILALPDLSLGTLAVLVGISFVVRGALAVVRGIRLRRLREPGAAQLDAGAGRPASAT